MRFLFIICMTFVALSAKAQMYVGGTFNMTHDDNADRTNLLSLQILDTISTNSLL